MSGCTGPNAIRPPDCRDERICYGVSRTFVTLADCLACEFRKASGQIFRDSHGATCTSEDKIVVALEMTVNESSVGVVVIVDDLARLSIGALRGAKDAALKILNVAGNLCTWLGITNDGDVAIALQDENGGRRVNLGYRSKENSVDLRIRDGEGRVIWKPDFKHCQSLALYVCRTS